MKDHQNVFVHFAMTFNQAATNSAARLNSWTERAILLFYHLQRVAVILASSTITMIPQTKLYGTLGRTLKLFQIGFWTEITPISYTDFVAFFFAIMMIEIAVISSFLYFVWRKKPIPALLETAITYQVFLMNRYLIYIPLYQSSYYVIFNAKSETVFYALSIFNLTSMTIIKVFFAIFSYRPAYSTAKFLAQYRTKEVNEMFGLLITLGIRMSNYNTASVTPACLLFAMTCTHIITLLFHPTYLVSALNRLDLFCHAFTFGFTLVIILQATAYNGSKMEFPFLLIASFLYWLMTNIDSYRKGKIFSLSNQKKTRSILVMKFLPYIYEEFAQLDKANGKLIEAIQPLLAHRSDNENNEEEVFSSEEYSLESVPLKQKANKAFINFISKSYEDYFKSPEVFRSGVQSIILAYLFFVRTVLQDNLKVLFLIYDFRRKLKAKRLSFGWLLGIQVASLERSCSHEHFSLKSENALDTSRVFVMLKQSDELISKMNFWTHRKIEFLEELNAPVVSLQVIKDKGIELVKDSKAILSYVRQEKDILKFSKISNAMKIFTEEVFQDQDYLTFDLKAISYMVYHASKLDFESLETFQIIEKLQNKQKNPIFMFATDDYSGNGGEITHNTEYLIQKLGYTQVELNHLYWSDILVAIEDNNNSSDIKRNHVSQAILRHCNGGFVAIKCTVHLDIIDDVPSIVLLGQEEPTYHQNFLLSKLDGTIEGTSKNFAETFPESIKFKGRKIQEILRLNYLQDDHLTDKHGSTPMKGKLNLSNACSSNSFMDAKEINFLITHLNNAIPSKDGYYLISIYEKYILTMFKNRNPPQENYTRLFVSQMEIKTEAPPLKSLKTLNFGSVDNLVTKKDELEFKSTDVLIPPGDEPYFDKVQVPQEPKLRTSKIDSNHHGFNFLSDQRTNSPAKSQLASRGRMSPISQELPAGTQNNFISINSFGEEEFNTSPRHKSEKLVDDEEEKEEQLERKRKLELFKNQRAFSVSSSVGGEQKQKRALERIKRKLKNPSVPLEIRSMKLLQIVFFIGLIVYLALEYDDLSRRYIILSELSGLTSFPLILLRAIYGFFQAQELVFTSLQQLWSPENRYAHLFKVTPVLTVISSKEFTYNYYDYIVQENMQTYYSDFRYDNYTIDLSLPETPYLNRAVDFHEALVVLRGYCYTFFKVLLEGKLIHEGAFSFLRSQSLKVEEMLWPLSEDLFNRMNKQFDEEVISLQLRVMFGGAVALLVGISVFYSFYKLHYYSDHLLSKTVTISGSEVLDEINRLEKKATIMIMHGSENGPHEKKNSLGATKKGLSKESPKMHSISKKYIPIRKEFLSKTVFIVFLVGLYLIPPIVGYFIKADPVSHCIPLLKQFKIIATNAQSSIENTCQVLEGIASAATGDVDQASNYVDQTQPLLERSRSQSAELSDFLNNQEALEENDYVSPNLTNAIASLRNNSYCDLLSSLSGDNCRDTTNGLSSLGIAAVRQKILEWTLNFRGQLKNSNFDPTVAAGLTFDQTLADLGAHGRMMSVALGAVTDIYIENFKEIATVANSTLKITLIMSLLYYALLLAVLVFPVILLVEKQYREIKEIYTLLPTQSLLVNPYIKNMLKGKALR